LKAEILEIDISHVKEVTSSLDSAELALVMKYHIVEFVVAAVIVAVAAVVAVVVAVVVDDDDLFDFQIFQKANAVMVKDEVMMMMTALNQEGFEGVYAQE